MTCLSVLPQAQGHASLSNKLERCCKEHYYCDFERRFSSLFLKDLVLVDKNAVWSFIDVGAREIVYVVALLSKDQYANLGKNQKPSYLNELTWILSRTGAAPATTYQCSGKLHISVQENLCKVSSILQGVLQTRRL